MAVITSSLGAWEALLLRGSSPARATCGCYHRRLDGCPLAVSDYVHAKGLRFGLWFGHSMCQTSNDTSNTRIATTATIDAEFFAASGVDAIKHDNCAMTSTSF